MALRDLNEDKNIRVWRAMKRLSRDRWLSPKETQRIAIALASCCSGRVSSTVTLVCGSCTHVGMINGGPPAEIHDPDWKHYLKLLSDREQKDDASTELAILFLMLKGAKRYGKFNPTLHLR